MVAESEPCSCLQTCSNTVETTLEKVFRKIGQTVGNYPWWTIFGSVAITLLFGCGYFINWTEESRTDKLWIPPDAQAVDDQDWVIDVFGYDLRFGELLLKPDSDGNALEGKYIQQFYTAYAIMVNTTSLAESGYRDVFNGTYSWNGYKDTTAICFKPDTVSCSMTHILDVLGYDYDKVFAMSDDEILAHINNMSNWDDAGGFNSTVSSIFGGIEYDDNGLISSVAILRGSYIISANVIVEDAEYIDPSREEWERTADENINSYDYQDCTVIPYFSATFSEEFSAAIGGDLALFGIGYTLIIVYAALALGKRDYVHSMTSLAGACITTVLLAMGGSYGLAGAIGVIYTPLAGSLPFLILGLGVDDAFIIVGEFQQVTKDYPGYSPALRMEKTMKHAGVSILITSLTDIIAFFIGSSTVLPALEAYCLFAAFGVLFVFFLNITFFAACVVIDSRRTSRNQADCCCCPCCPALKTYHPMFPHIESMSRTGLRNHSNANIQTPYNTTNLKNGKNDKNSENDQKHNNNNNNNKVGNDNGDINNNGESSPVPPENTRKKESHVGRLKCCLCCHLFPEELTRKAFRELGYFLMKPIVKVIVILSTLILLGISIYGATNLKQDFNIEWFLPDDSYLQEYFDWKNEYFNSGDSISIYIKDINYFEYTKELYQAKNLFESADYLVNDDYTDWHSNFMYFVNYTYPYIDSNFTQLTENNYYETLDIYLSSYGAQYSAYVEWNDENNVSKGIKGSYMTGEYQVWATEDAEAQVDAMNDIRDDVAKIADNDVMFAFTFQMLFWEQYAVIAQEMWRNIALAVGVVFLITIVLIPNIIASILVLTTVGFTIIDVVGLMWYWDLTIDGVTVCYTVIAIGLAVDYSAHVGEAYMLSKAATREDRVIDALYRMGASVFNGAFSTFLAVIAMAFATTYIFRVFFKQFFLVTTIGSAHGLIVLPVLLSLFGPAARLTGHDEDSDDDKQPKKLATNDDATPMTATNDYNLGMGDSPLPPNDNGNSSNDNVDTEMTNVET